MVLKLGIKNKGFTLIEVLAVIVIIAIIAAIAVPAVKNILTESKRDTFGLSAQKILDGVLQQEALTDEFEATEVSVQNLKDKLKMSNANYQELIITETNDNEYYIYIEGKNKWKNLVVCGTHDDIIVESKDNIKVCLGDNEQQEKEEEIPNSPVLAKGMTPIKWVNQEMVETTFDDLEWYNYNQNKWANAITADGSFWVWIPRFTYKITKGWHCEDIDCENGESGVIKISFSKGLDDTNDGEIALDLRTTAYASDARSNGDKYTNHPAFTFGNEELTGFWVGKFEMSVANTNDLCYTDPLFGTNCDNAYLIGEMKPGKEVWRKCTNDTIFTVSRLMETYSVYGWDLASNLQSNGLFQNDNNGIDVHLIKNREWGAVAYLTQSKYGKNSKVEINDTYCSGGGCSEGAYLSKGNQSTTGNEYGVYDMSGGAFETVASYLMLPNEDDPDYGMAIIKANDKYKDVYDGYNVSKKGDAIWETSEESTGYEYTKAWYGETSSFPTDMVNPWLARGDSYLSKPFGLGGAFAFASGLGGDGTISGWRVVLVAED